MNWFWKKKKLHKRVLFAIAVPYTKGQFLDACNRGTSDFIKVLEHKYKCKGEELWAYYKRTAQSIEKAIVELRKRGVCIVDCLTLLDIPQIKGMDATIIVAHHSNVTHELELFDKMVKDEDFVESIPVDYSGWLDLSCCSSERLQSLLRIHLPNPEAHIIAPDRRTAVNFRMELYPKVIKEMCNNNDLDYFDAFKKVINHFQQSISGSDFFAIEHLGGEEAQSSVYAPSEALRGQSFIVQVHIHKKADSDEIDLIAKDIDEDTSKKRSIDLSIKGKNIKLKKGDEIGVIFKNVGKKDDFKIETPSRKNFFWSGSATSVDFVVKVNDRCKADAFIGKISVSVNRITAAEVTFKTKIVQAYSDDTASELRGNVFMRFNRGVEMEAMRSQLLQRLNTQKQILTEQLQGSLDEKNRQQIERDLEICTNSIRVINEDTNILNNSKKIVFVSSTSDLEDYRKAVDEQIRACEMSPEMYEYWPQGDKTPSDICCAKVLGSDILVCILGARYGFVRPDTGSSMTEMELKCALQAGKPILIYVLKDYKEKMQSMLPKDQEAVDKQTCLIEQLERDRMIKYITDEISLSTISGRELERVKGTIS